MRKYYRYAIRRIAEKNGIKPSKYIPYAWNAYQERKVGYITRQRNIAKGTHPKRLWASRIRAVLG